MADRKQQNPPCIEFALLDATNPVQVARFVYWLLDVDRRVIRFHLGQDVLGGLQRLLAK